MNQVGLHLCNISYVSPNKDYYTSIYNSLIYRKRAQTLDYLSLGANKPNQTTYTYHKTPTKTTLQTA